MYPKYRRLKMGPAGIEAATEILDGFVEGLFRLMLDHHQSQVMEMDLTLVQAQALKLLRAEPLPTSKLAAALGISAPAVTQLTDRLGRKKLIVRQPMQSDRRAVMVAVTEKGGRVVDIFRRRRSEVFAGALSRLSNEDRMEVIGALGKVTAALQWQEPVPPQSLRVPAGVGTRQTERRTADDAGKASKELGRVGQEPVSRPTKRMRIEWD
jgi:DNA-binding MarR family transcriptional regulator